MKKTFGLLLIAAALLSCDKNSDVKCESYERMEVYKDCTGSYLRAYDKNEKSAFRDFLVCNEKKLKKFSTGDMINVCYEPAAGCDRNKIIVCDMLHEHAGIVNVCDIQQ